MKVKNTHNSLAGYNQQQLHQITDRFKPLKVKRNTYLLHEGEVCNQLYYIHTGCIRTFFIDKEGSEKTSSVIPDNFGTAWTSFHLRKAQNISGHGKTTHCKH